jgi:hypothetical protein
MGKKATYSILYLIIIDRKKIDKLDGKQAELRYFFISVRTYLKPKKFNITVDKPWMGQLLRDCGLGVRLQLRVMLMPPPTPFPG